jgi:flagellar biosynthetic protein FlhB
MAESSDQEKTEAPTDRRRQESRDEGRVPRSNELTTAMMLLGAALSLTMTGPMLSRFLLDAFGFGLTVGGMTTALDGTGAVRMLQQLGWKTVSAIAAVVGSMAGVALFVTSLQARGILSLKPITPQFERINPLTNAKRVYGTQSIADLVKSLIKLAIVSWAVYVALRTAWPEIESLTQQSPLALLGLVRHYAMKMLITAGLAYLALAMADYVFQLWQFEKNLKMSKEEVKQESKSQEGDPMMKQRRRSIGRQRARQQMFKDVPKADVVIVNPTHIAIAIKYDPSIAPAPYVVAMGRRKVAERIKKLAFQHGVPVVENRPLARAMIVAVRVGTMIPTDLYLAVAEVLAFIIRQRQQHGAHWQGDAVA